MGLAGMVSPARAAKKWENVKKTYKEVRKPPSGSGTELGEAMTENWKYFSLMDEATGGRPSIQPPCLIASAWGENTLMLASASPDSESVPSEPGSQTPEPEEPGPSKRQKRDPILELLEREEKRAEDRAKRAEAREERLVNLLEKIAEKM